MNSDGIFSDKAINRIKSLILLTEIALMFGMGRPLTEQKYGHSVPMIPQLRDGTFVIMAMVYHWCQNARRKWLLICMLSAAPTLACMSIMRATEIKYSVSIINPLFLREIWVKNSMQISSFQSSALL